MHKCVRCGSIYQDEDESILRGCRICNSVFFLHMKSQDDIQKLDAVVKELEKKDTTLETELIKEIKKKKIERKRKKVKPVRVKKEAVKKEVVVVSGKKFAVEDKFGVETIRMPKEGVYEINIDALMRKKPMIVFERGKIYIIHLPDVFEKLRKS
jgi:predicted  nucleic acid-binding Zn-ribbon protein